MVRRGVAFILILVLGLSFVTSNTGIENLECEELIDDNESVFEISYDVHAPFNITSDGDFETQGWPGNGSAVNPYLIQNLNITSTDSTCIWVMNTTCHFRIEDCLFVSQVYDYSLYPPIFPITLTNTSNGKVESNQFVDCSAAISGFQISNYSISDNELAVSHQGISVDFVNSTVISNNTQGSEPCAYGISIGHSRNCTVSFNRFDNITASGIMAWSVYNVQIADNSFTVLASELTFTWTGIEVWGGILCTIERNVLSNFQWIGVDASGSNFTVRDNNITACEIGIKISTNHSKFTGNRVNGSFNAIEMVQANDTMVYSNSILGRNGYHDNGIAIYGGHDCSVYLNVVSKVGSGIYLQGASRMNISSNSVINGRYGFIFGWFSNWGVADGPFSDCDIIGNDFDSGGVLSVIEDYESWDFDTIRFDDNTVSGGLIGLITDLNQYTIDGDSYAQLLLVNCYEVTIDGGYFNGIKSDVGSLYYSPGYASAIYLANCTACTIVDTVCNDNTIGIRLQDSKGCSLTGVEGQDNTWIAVSIEDSEEVDLFDVNLRSNRRGLQMSWSHNCRIDGCQIENNGEGITLHVCFRTTIIHNLLHQNNDSMFLEDSDDSEIRGNTIFMNERGILLNSTSDCLITQNNVANNTGVGISLDRTSYRNQIFNNTFAFNTPNAICEGSSNHWDNQVDTGNWWSDYSGEGVYIIDEDDQDNFPLTSKTATTNGTTPWIVDPLLLLGIAGGVGCIAILAVIIVHRRRVVIID
jgi:parallel beta-helix repeat protein